MLFIDIFLGYSYSSVNSVLLGYFCASAHFVFIGYSYSFSHILYSYILQGYIMTYSDYEILNILYIPGWYVRCVYVYIQKFNVDMVLILRLCLFFLYILQGIFRHSLKI